MTSILNVSVMPCLNKSNSSNAAFAVHPRANVTCFKCGKKGHYAKDYLEEKERTNLVKEVSDAAW